MTNKAANVLRNHSTLGKGDRLFVFMPRSPELYFSLLGALNMGVIVGPLFEAFMEGAIYDRLLTVKQRQLLLRLNFSTCSGREITPFKNISF